MLFVIAAFLVGMGCGFLIGGYMGLHIGETEPAVCPWPQEEPREVKK